jgi:aryl-alcohol dehydrogenase-like predicted oxidoreductase
MTCNACAARRTPNAGFRLPTDIEAEQSQQAAWDAGCRYWDTSPW